MGRSQHLVAAALVVVVCLAGCASMTTTENWAGRKIDDAIAKFGTPSRITPGVNGQQTYVWLLHHSGTTIINSIDPATGLSVPRMIPHDAIKTWMFVVAPDGTIVSWSQSET